MSFDRVLVDAPCSGLGVLRRRADARWRKTESIFTEMVPLQAELLDHAATLVHPEGALVYSVCSFEPEECEEQVAHFLERHPDWAIERPGPGLPAAALSPEGFVRVLHDQCGTDGVFAVRLRHRSALEGARADMEEEEFDPAAEDDASAGPGARREHHRAADLHAKPRHDMRRS
jgi:16S rRNA (cytosine967-C5)-methyltransferase